MRKTRHRRRASGRPDARDAARSRVDGRLVRLVVLLAGFMILFNVFFYTRFAKGELLTSYLAANAEVAAASLRLLHEDAGVAGTEIVSPRFSLDIKAGCDGLQASAFFFFAVLLSPVSARLRARILPILLGVGILLVVNLVRIVSLYYTGVYFPGAFETVHVEVWQAVFIVLPLILWIGWVRWSSHERNDTERTAP